MAIQNKIIVASDMLILMCHEYTDYSRIGQSGHLGVSETVTWVCPRENMHANADIFELVCAPDTENTRLLTILNWFLATFKVTFSTSCREGGPMTFMNRLHHAWTDNLFVLLPVPGAWFVPYELPLVRARIGSRSSSGVVMP